MVNRNTLIATVVMMFLIFATTSWAMPAELKSFLKDHLSTNICIELKNSSGDEKIDIAKIKIMIESAFTARKSDKFIVVSDPKKADLILRGDIVEYVWQEVDPVDQVWGVAAAAVDAASADNYARMQAKVELIDAKHGRTIWSDKVQADVTKTPMPKEASYEPVYSRFVNRLMTTLFRKRAD